MSLSTIHLKTPKIKKKKVILFYNPEINSCRALSYPNIYQGYQQQKSIFLSMGPFIFFMDWSSCLYNCTKIICLIRWKIRSVIYFKHKLLAINNVTDSLKQTFP